MKPYFKILIILNFTFSPFIWRGSEVFAQTNLVPNYSFEQLKLPCDYGMNIGYISDWYLIYGGTPDYFNTCANSITYPGFSTIPYGGAGYQLPKTGDGFIGFATYFGKIYLPPVPSFGDSINELVEYISVKLNAPLKANVCYYGEFYTSLAEICEYSSNRIAMLLTQTIFTTTVGSFTNTIQPQIEWDTTKFFTDTLNWVKISGSFIAQGGEQYLTIGNFKDGHHTKLQRQVSVFNSINVVGKTYVYHFVDDVVLYECSDTIKPIIEVNQEIPNVFTPNGDNTNDVWQFTLGNGNNLKSLHIYDRWGLEILFDTQETKTIMRWDGRTTAGEPCTAGVYFYVLEYNNILNEHKKLNGYITLIR